MADSGGGKLWSVFSLVSALAAATVAKKALDTGWKAATGKAALLLAAQGRMSIA